jgi:elongation of very long chain fatty acids protein 6
MAQWTPSDPSGRCVRDTPFGTQYEEISCLYPTMGKFYMSWEFNDFGRAFVWMRDNYVWFPPLMCCLYGAGIYFGRMYFEKREAWSWRQTLAVWNLGLSVFSTVGFCRMLPQLLHNLYYYGMWGQLCLDPENMIGSSTTGLWCMLFVLSKIPEFGDTFFIVIHKKRLMFLHWYHHISVLLCCWHSFTSKAPTGLFFGTMNYGVHSVMYFYYFLMAIKSKPKWFNPQVGWQKEAKHLINLAAVVLLFKHN